MPDWTETDKDNIDFLFTPPIRPIEDHHRHQRVSTLYLLRRELLDTLGHDPERVSEQEAARVGAKHRLFASGMLMFTAIDLLAKFEHGDSRKRGEIRRRFVALASDPDGLELTPRGADELWAVRNSITHAFGLPGDEELERLGLDGIGVAIRDYNNPETATSGNGKVLILYVDGVYRRLVQAIADRESVHASCRSAEGQERFREMFAKYGRIFHAAEHR